MREGVGGVGRREITFAKEGVFLEHSQRILQGNRKIGMSSACSFFEVCWGYGFSSILNLNLFLDMCVCVGVCVCVCLCVCVCVCVCIPIFLTLFNYFLPNGLRPRKKKELNR